MATITIEIDKDKDLSEDVEYTAEFKAMLDERYDEIISGRVKMISGEESQRQIDELIAARINAF
jgi:hypothetical protein